MISIRKYLYGAFENAEAAPHSDATEGMHVFSSAVLNAIQQFVLTGDNSEPLRSRLAALRNSLSTGWQPEESIEAGAAVSAILAEYRESIQRTAVSQTIEMQHIFAMLNQALIILAEGRDRSVSKLNQIQESLQRTSMIQDIVDLKWSLAETVRFIKQESAEAHSAATQELARFDAEVGRAREYLGSSRTELGGRPEGVNQILEWSKNVAPGDAVYVVAFLFERLQSVVQRYGPAVADELIYRLIKERVQPVAPAHTTYRWTSASLVAVVRRPRDLEALRTEVSELNEGPLVHRVALGSRMAVLTVTPSHLVAEGDPDPAALIEQVDRFTGAQP